jgi:dethiobiotin synthetase
MNYFVTAIDTDSGKTVASAILCEALNADYWKPIQAGAPRDSDVVRSLVQNKKTVIHPETYFLKQPASPHASAKLEKVTIDLRHIRLPVTANRVIVEGAGGCLVPLNDNDFVVDMITTLALPVVLVSDFYLGSINHTLLTIEALQKRKVVFKGIVFNGVANPESERIILKHSGLKKLLHLQKHDTMTKEIVSRYAEELKAEFNG